MRFLTAGESHGPALTAIIEGIPANLPLTEEMINRDLARRQKGYGRGGRMNIEKDRAEILSGVRDGMTLGSPITLQIKNRDWINWQEVMQVAPGANGQAKKITRPRPGHADLPGSIKYRQEDLRNILERASARETATRVAVGAVAKALLKEMGIHVFGHVTAIGGVFSPEDRNWDGFSPESFMMETETSPVSCFDREASEKMIKVIDQAKEAGDTLGGIFEILITGAPPGLGSHVHWDRKLDGRLAQALMSIQGIKGVEVGAGFQSAHLPGSKVHDEIYFEEEKGFFRRSNQAGGIEGGMTNGEVLCLRAVMKPIPTLMKPLKTVEMSAKSQVLAQVERSDVCAVPAASVVGEAACAIEMARALMEKTGGDTLEEMKTNLENYRFYIRQV